MVCVPLSSDRRGGVSSPPFDRFVLFFFLHVHYYDGAPSGEETFAIPGGDGSGTRPAAAETTRPCKRVRSREDGRRRESSGAEVKRVDGRRAGRVYGRANTRRRNDRRRRRSRKRTSARVRFVTGPSIDSSRAPLSRMLFGAGRKRRRF